MYIDQIIFAGVGTVGLVVLITVGIFYFMYRDAHKKNKHKH